LTHLANIDVIAKASTMTLYGRRPILPLCYLYLCYYRLVKCANQFETLTSPPPGIHGEFACLVFGEGGNLTFFSSGRWGICLGGRESEFFF
jgi:hypothetical protein